MHSEPTKIVRPDAKGRITLGSLANGISSFAVVQKDEKIILIPFAEIPAKEKWLFDNKKALQQVKQGLQESKEGKVKSLGNFKKHFITE
jgi:hypothetical protein